MPRRGGWFWRLTHWSEMAESHGWHGLGCQGLCGVSLPWPQVDVPEVAAASCEQPGALQCSSKQPAPPQGPVKVQHGTVRVTVPLPPSYLPWLPAATGPIFNPPPGLKVFCSQTSTPHLSLPLNISPLHPISTFRGSAVLKHLSYLACLGLCLESSSHHTFHSFFS